MKMNSFFTLVSIFNIDYFFNSSLKKTFVILKCLVHITFNVLNLLRREYFFLYLSSILVIQLAHAYYDKNGTMRKFYYFDPIYLISTPFLSAYIGAFYMIVVQILKVLFGMYFYARIQMEQHFYCYGKKPWSEWMHGMCPAPYDVPINTLPQYDPICLYEDCYAKPNIIPYRNHLIIYIGIIVSVGIVHGISKLRSSDHGK